MCALIVAEWIEQIGFAQTVSAPSFRHLSHGVPVGGPFDQVSATIAQVILGNSPEDPLIELCPGRFRIRFSESTTVCLVGAEAEAFVGDDPRDCQSAFLVERHQTLLILAPKVGYRLYLGLPGGAMSSNSSLFAGRLEIQRSRALASLPGSLAGDLIRYIPSPNTINLSGRGFCASIQSNRTGIRLSPNLESHSLNILSEPATPGVIQHTPSGGLIVLGPDGPTIGGYPKLGTVTQLDLSRLAQLRPGEKFTLQAVSRETALSARQEAQAQSNRLLAALRIEQNQSL